MWLPGLVYGFGLLSTVRGTIIQNGQVRETNYLDTRIDLVDDSYTTYANDASEISYLGRWDSKKVSWWAAPGIRFGFTGQTVAVTFGEHTIDGTLVGYRLSGLDWQFTNVTSGGTHLFISPEVQGVELTAPVSPSTFEMRVTNWGYGVQIDSVHVSEGEELVKLPRQPRFIEFIGDSLSAGMYNSYEALSGFAYGVGQGLGNTDYSITAYPGICVSDQDCWGNTRGQSHQWFYTTDNSWRSKEIWGDEPEPWDFGKQQDADLVIINLGTNDANAANNVTKETYVEHYKRLIQGIHGVWPDAQVVVMQMWQGFYQDGNSYAQNADLREEVYSVYKYFNSEEYLSNAVIWDGINEKATKTETSIEPFVHFFNTTGILQHNDIAPQWHPTDVGQIKVASHLIQFITQKFGWYLYATGPEVFADTLYWNDQSGY
ncbi:hypothetical protein SAPIO_CDS10067 [Scedosporium apiospermum]|uniref:SGNH hydrolase-type esterase domain-containing protein n=1 Tax=Pseudallescheria apiosperma TaxID=563466 RepID=A0A084FWA5_PSEDA|nr:uncharacterized protein SAPIO_CDS10067 [Scedosporium apiospermum]KEZ39367.1 hypothetical protein SAPIO_CDS10067 [Scedosporium apiospermum]